MFTPDFYDYYKLIEEELRSRGAFVYSVLENYADRDLLYRFFWIKNKKTRQSYAKRILEKDISSLNFVPDIIFVIRGEALSSDTLDLLKGKFPNARYIMYQWDSVRNNPNALDIAGYFEKVLTFDLVDAKEYGWKYRPLFYLGTGNKKYNERQYDMALIGTLYYKRAELLKKLKTTASKMGYKLFDYLYSPKIVFYLHKYLMRDKRYDDISKDEVKFSSLSLASVREVYKDVKCLVDYTADDQAGLTMRTIESIGYGCKLITNNKAVSETDFYDPSNILIYDINSFDIPDAFIKTEYVPISEEVFRYYSLSGWIDSIFE